jgi:hypothetical protein
MISYAGYRTGFPFPLRHKSANGLPFEAWDGSTLSDGSPAASSGAEVYGQGTEKPLGLSLPVFAELFWRIKRLVLNYDYVMYYDDGAGNVSATGAVAVPIDADNEAQLIAPATAHFGADSGREARIDYSDVWKIGDLYYPTIRAGVAGRNSEVGNGTEFGLLSNPVSGLTINLLGDPALNLNLWGSNVLATVGQDPPYSGTGTIEIVGDEYWTYGGKFLAADGSRV